MIDRAAKVRRSRASADAISLALLRIQKEVNQTVMVVPGGYDMPMIAAAYQLGFRLIVARSESGAAWMAAALAWETQRPTVILAITSPGVYGTIQAFHYAYVSRVPLVLVSGESSLAGSVQAGDGVGGPSVTRVTAPLTAWSADVTRPAELPGALLRAVRIAATSSRPVHLNVPVSVAAAQVAP
jgi:acetolactate synthase-1/2/3 large subunit